MCPSARCTPVAGPAAEPWSSHPPWPPHGTCHPLLAVPAGSSHRSPHNLALCDTFKGCSCSSIRGWLPAPSISWSWEHSGPRFLLSTPTDVHPTPLDDARIILPASLHVCSPHLCCAAAPPRPGGWGPSRTLILMFIEHVKGKKNQFNNLSSRTVPEGCSAHAAPGTSQSLLCRCLWRGLNGAGRGERLPVLPSGAGSAAAPHCQHQVLEMKPRGNRGA